MISLNPIIVRFSIMYSILYMNVSTLTRIDCPLAQSNFKTCQMLRWEMATQFFNNNYNNFSTQNSSWNIQFCRIFGIEDIDKPNTIWCNQVYRLIVCRCVCVTFWQLCVTDRWRGCVSVSATKPSAISYVFLTLCSFEWCEKVYNNVR